MAIEGKNADLFRRLRFYGFGFLLGLLAVSFLYKGKSCQLPGSAKLEELGWQKLEFTAQVICNMKCKNITEQEIKQVFKSGKVNYDKSDVHRKPYPSYAVEGITANGKSLELTIDDVDTVSRVVSTIDIKMQNDTCDCK